jgi:hypothetical protein
MSKAAPNCNGFRFLDKKLLVNLKTKAMRSGVWFKALQRIDRVLFDLTMSCRYRPKCQVSKKHTRAHKEAGRCNKKQFFKSFEGNWFASSSENKFNGSEAGKHLR